MQTPSSDVSMNVHSGLDRSFFQKLLEDAYAVQQSGIDPESLSAVVQVQRSMTIGGCDLDQVIRLVVDRARVIGNADGIAIALMHANELVYRTGSGSASSCEGRCLAAVLSPCANNDRQTEVLRVENAETDQRIQAEICRQFEAKSLLILPIYGDRTVAGVLEIRFTDAHTFEKREVRGYRLMARLVEETIARGADSESKDALKEAPRPPAAADQITVGEPASACREADSLT